MVFKKTWRLGLLLLKVENRAYTMRIVREKEERTKDLWHCQLPFLRNFLEYNRTSLFFKEELCRGYIYPDSVDMVTAGHESGRSARYTPWEGSYPMVA